MTSYQINTSIEKEYEVYLLMDGSGSVENWFSDIQNICSKFANSFAVGNSKLGIILFSNESIVISEPTNNLNQLEESIKNMKPPFGGTKMLGAFEIARNKFQIEPLPINKIHKRIVIAVTDGLSENYEQCIKCAKEIQDLGATVVTVGVTDDIWEDMLTMCASPLMFFKYKDFSALRSNVDELIDNITSRDIDIGITKHFCNPVKIGNNVKVTLELENVSLKVIKSPIQVVIHESDYFMKAEQSENYFLHPYQKKTFNLELKPKQGKNPLEIKYSCRLFISVYGGDIPLVPNANILYLPARVFMNSINDFNNLLNLNRDEIETESLNFATIGPISSGKSTFNNNITQFIYDNSDANPFDCGKSYQNPFTTKIENYYLSTKDIHFGINIHDTWGWIDSESSKRLYFELIRGLHQNWLNPGHESYQIENLSRSNPINSNIEYMDVIAIIIKSKTLTEEALEDQKNCQYLNTLVKQLENFKIPFVLVVTHLNEIADPIAYTDPDGQFKLFMETQIKKHIPNISSNEIFYFEQIDERDYCQAYHHDLMMIKFLQRIQSLYYQSGKKRKIMRRYEENVWFTYNGVKYRTSIKNFESDNELHSKLKKQFKINTNSRINLFDSGSNVNLEDIKVNFIGTKNNPIELRI